MIIVKRKDPVRTYLKEIGRTALLSKEEEHELAERAQKGDDVARERLIKANLRLVVSVAKRFKPSSSLSFSDFIQEGNLGLIEAINNFDPQRGTKLSTYATIWIRQAIFKAIEKQASTIRLSAEVRTLKRKIRRAEEEWADQHDKIPGDAELLRILNITKQQIKRARLGSTSSPFSLDKERTLSSNEGETFLDLVPDQRASSMDIDENWFKNAKKRRMEQAMEKCLSDKEKEIIRLRCGTKGKEGKTLRQIAEIFGVTKERISQIERKAVMKLKEEINRPSSSKTKAKQNK